jgi:hypothetical protein
MNLLRMCYYICEVFLKFVRVDGDVFCVLEVSLNSMENHSWKTCSQSAGQQISLVSVLSQIYLVHTLLNRMFKIHFNIIRSIPDIPKV